MLVAISHCVVSRFQNKDFEILLQSKGIGLRFKRCDRVKELELDWVCARERIGLVFRLADGMLFSLTPPLPKEFVNMIFCHTWFRNACEMDNIYAH